MTQSRASANACSARRRSAADSEECETKVVDLPLPQRSAELLDASPAVAEDQPLLAPVQGGDHRGGVVEGADVVELRPRCVRCAGRWRCAPRRGDGPVPEPWSQASSSSGLPTVADRPIRCSGRAGQLGDPFQDGEQVPAAVVAGEGVDLVDHDGADAGEESAVRRSTLETASTRATPAW